MLTAISRKTQNIAQKTVKENTKGFKWYIRKYAFNIKEGSNGELEEHNRPETYRKYSNFN